MAGDKLRVLITGGGTGGHVYPGLVIAEELRRLYSDTIIKFVGTPRGLESRVVPQLGYDISYIDVRYFVRALTPDNFVTLYKALAAVVKARKLLRQYRPHVVVGTGGYVSGPVVLAAVGLKIPTLIQEQNAFPGLTTRLLAGRVDKVAVSHADAVKSLPAKANVLVTGHPVRREFFAWDRQLARRQLGLETGQKLVLAVGGSGGAHCLNQVVLECAGRLLEDGNIVLLHATGRRYYQWAAEHLANQGLDAAKGQRYWLKEFVDDMPRVMAACDLVIARSGGMVHEITAAGRPSVLIPSPNVTDDHQLHNALSLAKAGAAVVVEEKDLDSTGFLYLLRQLLSDQQKLQSMAAQANRLGKPDAGERIAKLVVNLAKKGSWRQWT